MSYSQLAQSLDESEVTPPFTGAEFGLWRPNWSEAALIGIDWAAGEAPSWVWRGSQIGPATFSLQEAVPGLAVAMIVARRYAGSHGPIQAPQRPVSSSSKIAARQYVERGRRSGRSMGRFFS